MTTLTPLSWTADRIGVMSAADIRISRGVPLFLREWSHNQRRISLSDLRMNVEVTFLLAGYDLSTSISPISLPNLETARVASSKLILVGCGTDSRSQKIPTVVCSAGRLALLSLVAAAAAWWLTFSSGVVGPAGAACVMVATAGGALSIRRLLPSNCPLSTVAANTVDDESGEAAVGENIPGSVAAKKGVSPLAEELESKDARSPRAS
mmetsp:Transcript_16266/g.25264  ORF Transcript_16266/g.25264 Transcript_16266/m.25264 type:complete len:208 (+) Transcript_16266:1024-1647(+)